MTGGGRDDTGQSRGGSPCRPRRELVRSHRETTGPGRRAPPRSLAGRRASRARRRRRGPVSGERRPAPVRADLGVQLLRRSRYSPIASRSRTGCADPPSTLPAEPGEPATRSAAGMSWRGLAISTARCSMPMLSGDEHAPAAQRETPPAADAVALRPGRGRGRSRAGRPGTPGGRARPPRSWPIQLAPRRLAVCWLPAQPSAWASRCRDETTAGQCGQGEILLHGGPQMIDGPVQVPGRQRSDPEGLLSRPEAGDAETADHRQGAYGRSSS